MKAWLSLGANIGDPPAQLAEAIRRIGAHEAISVTRQSAVLATKPWGKTDQPDFANQALEVETRLEPIALLDVILGIELDMGRVREEVWGPRIIDIDMIAYDRVEMQTPRLTLPHPYAHERDFVLVPLREIDADVANWIVGRKPPLP
ncbi:2-amino-4-hydroxy-6-hydroxymethyldihydropteridine pyrophosphokinase [Devosia sp. Root436]|jgi:2-amino-4-hydroxy-6-hydroxymethyldihydropteridine diphosphokinase|uniref:2-amino-4-hydroxy-6- hydroxymethyldihydropteridine diphosphokinase n=1 Tax=Devosia sp. Root436 TaxID=1736537 RepID=UPI0006F7981A|nr:2-amino-4-hydroxy-6-hydroxymethyldihydropteridine diphosphokinase [Devosia sp. Root436]KQX42589.1 2-amino-4-hydroxy-6-hydroxymethyldihydropteridine pyrophosphokinase [Devosia sp. Root436]